MKNIFLAVGCLVLSSVAGFAQGSGEHYAQGYAFFAPTLVSQSSTNAVHFGGGGEALIKRVGIGGELGYLTPWQYLSEGVGVGSVNGSFNLKPGKVSPFVTGGYTVFFRSGSANGYNLGGGIHYWLTEKTGLRFEIRDNVLHDYYSQHYVGFRIGVTFR